MHLQPPSPQERNEEALEEMLGARRTFEGETRLLQENIAHLELLRNNLEQAVSAKEEQVGTCIPYLTWPHLTPGPT